MQLCVSANELRWSEVVAQRLVNHLLIVVLRLLVTSNEAQPAVPTATIQAPTNAQLACVNANNDILTI